MKSLTTEKARHIVFRLQNGDSLPDALTRELRDQCVLCGWVRASGVLAEIELRAYGSDIGGPGAGRRIAGPVQVVVLEGSVGLADGDVSVGMRAVIARETDRGIEALAGEIVAARVVALEGIITAFDDLAISRALDPDAGVWLFGDGTMAAPAAAAPATEKAKSPAWSEAASASAPAANERAPLAAPRAGSTPAGSNAMPRPIRNAPFIGFDDGPFPEPGDQVEHFAFGTCDVVKSDGDRLHVKIHKDGRVREIALEMLKVTLLTTDGETRRYRLDRKL